jgi:hypothetical protein
MTYRLLLPVFAALVVSTLALSGTAAVAEEKKGDAEYLFVQNASSGSFDGKVLTLEGVQLLFVQNAKDVALEKNSLVLKGVAPQTIFFTDRPERMAGHMTTAYFVDGWGKGENSFAADPPNAALSVFGEKEVVDVVVTLMNPRLEGEILTMTSPSLKVSC